MRIIHVLPHLRRSGNGIVNAVVDLAVEQVALGHDVTVCAESGEFVALLQQFGVRHKATPTEGWKNLKRFRALRRELRVMRRSDPGTVIHTHTLGLLMVVFSIGRKRLVHTIHNPWQRFSILARLVPAKFIVLSVRALGGVRSSAASVVENGIVGSRRYDVPNIVPRDLERPALVTVCGLYERKGVQDLIDAVGHTSARWHLYVVGEGPYRAALEGQVKTAALEDRVHLIGFDKEPLSWVASADAFALVSHSEGGALVLTEARMLHRPVIYTPVGDMPSMMRDQAGLAVPPGDPSIVATHLDFFVESPGAIDRASADSQRGLDWYHVSRVAQQTLAVYEGLVA